MHTVLIFNYTKSMGAKNWVTDIDSLYNSILGYEVLDGWSERVFSDASSVRQIDRAIITELTKKGQYYIRLAKGENRVDWTLSVISWYRSHDIKTNIYVINFTTVSELYTQAIVGAHGCAYVWAYGGVGGEWVLPFDWFIVTQQYHNSCATIRVNEMYVP